MSTAVNIVVADATPVTPVNHTFAVVGQDAKTGITHWVDRSPGTPLGYWEITQKVTPPVRPKGRRPSGYTQATGNYRTRIVLKIPVMETGTTSDLAGIPAAPTLSYTCLGDVSLVLPERSSPLVRQHLAKMLPLLLQNALMKAAVEDLDQAR